jgi:hypothetical protein
MMRSRIRLLRLYVNTMRHLGAGQLAYLAARPLRRLLARPNSRRPAATVAAGRLAPLRAAMTAQMHGSIEQALDGANAVVAGEFRFLGVTRMLDEVDWGVRSVSPLWSFNLQYGAFIEDLARAFEHTGDERFTAPMVQLVDAWIDADKPIGSDAWAPYAVARRLVHWMRAFLICHDALAPGVRVRWAASMASQTRFLARNIEWHLRANHVQKNLHAVFCAAALFDDEDIEELRRRAGRQLWQQFEEQVLPDGMHYERSPMYHASVLSDYREAVAVARLIGHALPAQIDDRLDAMAAALSCFVRADGTMHLFNDATNDGDSSIGRLLGNRHAPTGDGVWALPDAGYYGGSAGRWRFIIDCGEPGPACQPAHGHCDLLSFELDLDGVPFIVDSGTSGYDGDPLRPYMRSTRAHNTVQIGGGEQHELWGTFRMARRARVGAADIDAAAGRFTGWYSPYFSSRTVHRRTVYLNAGHVRVEDTVEGAAGACLRTFLHLHPSFTARVDGGTVKAAAGPRRATIELANIGDVAIVAGESEPSQGWYAPKFGVRLSAPAIVMTAADPMRPFGYTIRCQ